MLRRLADTLPLKSVEPRQGQFFFTPRQSSSYSAAKSIRDFAVDVFEKFDGMQNTSDAINDKKTECYEFFS